jgi:hypothetical protein
LPLNPREPGTNGFFLFWVYQLGHGRYRKQGLRGGLREALSVLGRCILYSWVYTIEF